MKFCDTVHDGEMSQHRSSFLYYALLSADQSQVRKDIHISKFLVYSEGNFIMHRNS